MKITQLKVRLFEYPLPKPLRRLRAKGPHFPLGLSLSKPSVRAVAASMASLSTLS